MLRTLDPFGDIFTVSFTNGHVKRLLCGEQPTGGDLAAGSCTSRERMADRTGGSEWGAEMREFAL